MKSFNHFGVYGICERNGRLLVIHKGRGAYTGRYDLPGGRLELDESLADGLVREFKEETGLSVRVRDNLGTFDFFVRYQEGDFTHMHHIAALYTVEILNHQNDADEIAVFSEQDSLGMEWVRLEEITHDTASPVAVQAARWLAGSRMSPKAEYYEEWEMRSLRE